MYQRAQNSLSSTLLNTLLLDTARMLDQVLGRYFVSGHPYIESATALSDSRCLDCITFTVVQQQIEKVL